ncbi:MAG: LysM peptidoglycan-binding domain-containing protein [Terrimicrobiaceae bacterium]
MLKRTAGLFLSLSLWGAAAVEIRAQTTRPAAAPGVEHGLEEAVKWKWRTVPSEEKNWGLDLPEPPPAVPLDASPTAPVPRDMSNSHEVRKGDALILIGEKFGVTVAQLKAANGLDSDMIRIGQVLKIPTPEECMALGLPPEPPKPPIAPGANSKTDKKSPDPAGALDQEVFLLQIFLDRENFTSGPINGKTSLDFQKLVYLYQLHHPDEGDTDLLKAKALASVGDVIAKYTLKHEDFRFIAPPKAEKPSDIKPAKPKGKATPEPTPVPLPTYGEMTSSTMLSYQSPWEFVAERFHCSENLLRLLNPGIQPLPAAGTGFRVPNVVPFQIEKAFDPPLQPFADPQNVITAAVVALSRLEIYRNDRLVAVMPIAPARPGLRGRGTWKILGALPRPQLATLQEPRETPKPTNTFFTGEGSQPVPAEPVLTSEQYLPAGPNNPVGVLWIDLAKSDSPDPLPYGLHGTGIPSEMNSRTGLGGFRLTNWDIIRAVRLLPKGTPLLWKQTSAAVPQASKPAL